MIRTLSLLVAVATLGLASCATKKKCSSCCAAPAAKAEAKAETKKK